MSDESKETLKSSLSKASRGISSFFEELDIFKMKVDENNVVPMGEERDAQSLAPHSS